MAYPEIDMLYLNEKDMIAAGVTDTLKCVETMEEVLKTLDRGDYRMGGENGDSHGCMVYFPDSIKHFPGMPKDGPDRRFMCMPAYLGGKFHVAGVKWYGSNVENREKGLPRSILMVTLNDPETGAPFAYESANLISAYRTAAIPGAGVKNLAKEDAKVLGIVGPGIINSITVETFAALRPSLDTLKIKGRGRASIDRCIAYVKEKCPQFKNIEVVDTIEDCVKGSDIMSFATSTPTGGHENYPYVKREWIKPGALICAPGAIDTDEDLITDFFQESAKKDICLHPDSGFAEAGREQKHLVGVGENLLDQKTPLAAGTKHHFHGKIIERHIGVQSNESRRNCIMFGKRKHDNFRAGSILKTAYQRQYFAICFGVRPVKDLHSRWKWA